ncbi:RICIN domain-containing protein [Enterococcus sp. DIV0660C]|uniref:RICIN domain-containing protein n=1 Tax=Enterococcus sp. DIV0660C TaxID=2230880 RepID=UPI001A8CFB14|nr:RICIN domain-containing protein [Enterococcus sp. DIV0660C]MBO0432208.1 ricin-type beta-trefoil lectin domain protein [Enterococcus sp. DIV0660C]
MKKLIGLFFTLFLFLPQVLVNADVVNIEGEKSIETITHRMSYSNVRPLVSGPFFGGWELEAMRVTDYAIEFDASMGIYGGPSEYYPNYEETYLATGPGKSHKVQGIRKLRETKNNRNYYTIRFERDQYINGETTVYFLTLTRATPYFNYLSFDLHTGITENYNDLLVSIQSKIDPWKVVDWYEEQNTAISFNNDGNSNQKWYLKYNEAKNAYSIHSYKQTAYSLIENSNGTVGVKPNVSNNDSALWQLIWEGNHTNGQTYFLKNLKSGKVMDIEESKLDGGNIITFNKINTENQKFILHIEGRK